MRSYLFLLSILPLAVFAQLPVAITLEPGTNYTVTVKVTNKLIQQAEGQAIDFLAGGQAVHRLSVVGSGNRQVQHQLRQVAFNFDGMGAVRSFDSESEEDMSGELGPSFAHLKSPYTITCSNTGIITQVDNQRPPSPVADPRLAVILDMVKELSEYAALPDKGARAYFSAIVPNGTALGQTWMEKDKQAETTYKLTGINDSTYTISYQASGKDSTVADLNGIISTTRVTTEKNGTIVAFLRSGIVRSHTYVMNTNGIREAMGTRMPFSATKTVSMIIRPE